MLTANGNAGRATAGFDDVLDEAGKRRGAADEEGGDGAPVAGEFGRVAVDAVEIVHVRYRHVAASDNIVAVARDKRVSGHWHVCVYVWGEGTNSVMRIDVIGPRKMV